MKINLLPHKFDEEQALIELDHIRKEGYAPVKSMPTWLMNEYRELTLEKAVSIVNKWVVTRKIRESKLHCVALKNAKYVLNDDEYAIYSKTIQTMRSMLNKENAVKVPTPTNVATASRKEATK